MIIPNLNEIYDDYIERILNSRPNVKDKQRYQERHHIIPRCLNGSNDKDNLIYLYPEEHYYAHKLLVVKFPDNIQLSRAWWLMAHINYKQCSAVEYQQAREDFYSKLSILQKGKPLPEACRNAAQEYLNQQKIPVRCIETNTEYDSFIQAEKMTKIPGGNIRHAAIGERLSAGGLHWELINPTDEQKKLYKYNRKMLDKSKQYKSVICLDTGEIFKSCYEVCQHYGIDLRNLSAVLNGKRSTTQNKRFEFLDPSEEDLDRITKNIERLKQGAINAKPCERNKILCVELGKVFNSQSEAARELNLNPQNISAVIVGKQLTCGGYHWKYI